jgi:hypothetical protein
MRFPRLIVSLIAVMAVADEHRCIYVNNDSSTPAGASNSTDGCGGANCVSVLSFGTGDDVMRLIRSIPTGGQGIGGGYTSSPRIAATPPGMAQGCLFVVNAGSDDISAFVYRLHDNGSLAPVRGSPFSTGGRFGELGGGVTLHPRGQFLYTSNSGSDSISSFLIRPDCGLMLLQPVPAPVAPADLQVNRAGSCMAVASLAENMVAMYDVREVFPREVARYPVAGPGAASGVEFSSRLDIPKLYVGKENPDQTVVTSYTVNDDCTLAGDNVTISEGLNSAVTKLTPDESCLFVPNQDGGTMTTFTVDPASGELTLVGTFDGFATLTATVVFASGDTGLKLLTNVYDPRQVARRNVMEGCVPGPLDQEIATGIVSPGGLLRGIVVAQEQ